MPSHTFTADEWVVIHDGITVFDLYLCLNGTALTTGQTHLETFSTYEAALSRASEMNYTPAPVDPEL
jgi:hypothetical protein